jgi:iron-sulfur cluster repair protein YtfE (RIC family)
MSGEIPTAEMAVRELAERWPAAARVLHRRGLDLCCGGAHPLAMAAAAHGQDAAEILAEIRAELAREDG